MKPEVREWYEQLSKEQRSRLDIFSIYVASENRHKSQLQALYDGEDVPDFIRRFIDDPNIPSVEETVKEIENKYEYVKGEFVEKIQ
ncbi:hypothetical protein [Enterococcus malodoratus]|uniref:hypothetical protein n=1 Tax=Enterococcus malodoratus TaxID=71451 RepID=UPI0039AF3A6A